MHKISDLLSAKGSQVWSIGPAHSVFQAIEMMALKEVGALTVLSDEGKVVGIISERDYARKVILMGKSSVKTPVSEIMTRDVIYVEEDAQVDECMALMTAKKVRHLPVLKEDQLIGMISVGDLVKKIIDDQTFVIEQLERYIKGEAAGVKY
jgi:CBS domain-containing protein